MLYTMSPTEVCSRREPVSPVTENGASPKHLTKNVIGLKTEKVSAGRVVILLHEKPDPLLKSLRAEELCYWPFDMNSRAQHGHTGGEFINAAEFHFSFLPFFYLDLLCAGRSFFQIKLMLLYLS